MNGETGEVVRFPRERRVKTSGSENHKLYHPLPDTVVWYDPVGEAAWKRLEAGEALPGDCIMIFARRRQDALEWMEKNKIQPHQVILVVAPSNIMWIKTRPMPRVYLRGFWYARMAGAISATLIERDKK